MSAWVEPMLSNAIVATLLAMLIGVVAVFRPRRVVIHALWLIVLLKLLAPPLIRFELLSDLLSVFPPDNDVERFVRWIRDRLS